MYKNLAAMVCALACAVRDTGPVCPLCAYRAAAQAL